jgi:hypothetical protein
MTAALGYLYVCACLLKSVGECDFANMSGARPLFGAFAGIVIKESSGFIRASEFKWSLLLWACWMGGEGARIHRSVVYG